MDVDSYLPYEGRVRISNKVADSVAIRVPGWVRLDQAHLSLDGAPNSPRRVGRYLLVDGLRPGNVIELSFDVPQGESEYIAHGCHHRFKFRGSTVVDVSPRAKSPLSYPIYQREHMKARKAPMKKAERFVAHRE